MGSVGGNTPTLLERSAAEVGCGVMGSLAMRGAPLGTTFHIPSATSDSCGSQVIRLLCFAAAGGVVRSGP